MRFNDRIRGLFVFRGLCAAALLASGSAGATVMNGDFSAGLSAWGVAGGPSVSDGGGFALLENDGGSGFRALEQTFGLPVTGGALSFDFHFTTAANQQNGDDSFFVGLDVGGTLLSLLVIDDSFGLVPDPDFPVFSLTPLSIAVVAGAASPIPGAPVLGGTTHFGTLSFELPADVWGMDATLFFELADGFFNTFDTRVAVDNVILASPAVTVSEPPLLALLLGGLLIAVARIRRAGGDHRLPADRG